MPFFQLPTGGASPVLAGNGAPTGALGNIGDLYLDKAGSLLFGPKTLDGWGDGVDLIGATGPTGPTAPASTLTIGSVTTGEAAAHITGTSPTFTIDFTLPFVTGPQGEVGSTGAASTVTGPTGVHEYYATGSAPTPILEGALWLDTDTGRYFVNYDGQFIEIGVQGEAGPTGSTGPQGEAGPQGEVANNDARLSDARTPTAHASTHATGGSDALTPGDIGAAPAASPEFTGIIRSFPSGVFSTAYNSFVGDGVYLSSLNTVAGPGTFGAAISWSRLGNSSVRSAAISSVQTGADSDLVGLAFFVHASSSASADIEEAMRIDHGKRVGIGTESPATALDVNGVITVSAGSAAAPAIVSGTGTADSGIYWPAADTFAVSTAGTERLRVDSSGKVGIGTASPTAALDINSDTIRLRTAKTPASASDTGNAGDICWDASYLYICTDTDTWRRIAHSTW